MEAKDKEKDPPGHDKSYTIFVNGTEFTHHGDEISFEQVIKLAFGDAANDPNIIYTVTYERAHGNKEGTLRKEQSVKVKEGMSFDATDAGRS
jgi:hypothetical protein